VKPSSIVNNPSSSNIKEFMKTSDEEHKDSRGLLSTETIADSSNWHMKSDEEFLKDSLADLITYAKHPLRKVLAEEADITIVD
jgi:hypothetical protein